MMTIKQWLVLLCIFFGYIVFGASVFYLIESKEEAAGFAEETKQQSEIEDLVEKYYTPNEPHTKDDFFGKISTYCDKPLGTYMPNDKNSLHWTFYHSIFFVLTVISTIGYGNLAPTTPFTRTFVIIYGIIGIPINGIVVITLGDFFGRTFYRIYKRWKNHHVNRVLATCGFIGQIILYSIPGFTLLILIPSLIIVLYEDWTYDLAVEFAFATLTTVGVGHIIPGANENGHGEVLFLMYKMFLLLWIIVGLGYLAMVFGFISRGLRSKHVHKLEHKITRNIKKTNRKIRHELRSLINEYLLMRVKPVYRERRINAPMACQRTQSCPDLRFEHDLVPIKTRKRAFSEMPRPVECFLSRRQSDTDLQCIDKERTFRLQKATNEHNKLLLRVVNALSNYNTMTCSSTTVGDTEDTDTFFDHCESQWSADDREYFRTPEPMRPRAATESRKQRLSENCNVPWRQRSDARQIQENREREKYGKARSRTLPPIVAPQNLFTRLKNTFKPQPPQDEKLKAVVIDIESQVPNTTQNEPRLSDFSMLDKDQLLEETTLADFLRALTVINFREISRPRRKFGTADSTCVPRTRRLPITPVLSSRKISLMPSSPSQDPKQRRLSLNPTLTLSASGSDFTPLASPAITSATFFPKNSKIASQVRKVSFSSCHSPQRERLKSISMQKIVDSENKND